MHVLRRIDRSKTTTKMLARVGRLRLESGAQDQNNNSLLAHDREEARGHLRLLLFLLVVDVSCDRENSASFEQLLVAEVFDYPLKFLAFESCWMN